MISGGDGGDDLLRVGRGRRSDDHPDWKAVAPRWLLVIIAAAFVAMVSASGYEHLDESKRTVHELAAVSARTSTLERGFEDTALELAYSRVDMLSFQIYYARRGRVDQAFLADLQARLSRAETRVENLEARRARMGRRYP
jgi:hypothetical protein